MSSLIEIDGNTLKPISDLGIALLDKIEKATGWIFSTTTAKKEGYKNIIEEISRRDDINPIDRAAIISNYKKIIKEHKNRTEIVSRAVQLLNKGSNIENIDEEWLLRFFDLCKNVNNEEMQYVWAKILANECEEEQKNSFKLLRIISDLTNKDVNLIMNFIKECNYVSNPYELIGIVCENIGYLDSINIKYKDILKLEELGIIKKDTISLPNEFSYTLDDRIVTFKRKR